MLRLTIALFLFVVCFVQQSETRASTPMAPTAQTSGSSAAAAGKVSVPELAGVWCVEGNASDCLRLTFTGTETVSGIFQDRGSTYAEAAGYARAGKLSMAFRRTNNQDLGFVTFILRDATSADSRTFNPDGTQRWRGVYRKR
jgi:hypothetical protein